MRLDNLIISKKLTRSRNIACDLIKKGLVKVNGETIIKVAKNFPIDALIEIIEQPKYVGRGGLKLEKALKEFKIDPTNLIVLDVGSSTGGFTDCLLQNGAQKIYAVDVGTGQLDSSLLKNERVISLEQTDIRNIKSLPKKPDLAVIDVSFISLELILSTVFNLLKTNSKIIALIKPQFETPKGAKNKNGIVKSDELRKKAVENIEKYCKKSKFKILAIIDSPILGSSGNKEFLILLEK